MKKDNLAWMGPVVAVVVLSLVFIFSVLVVCQKMEKMAKHLVYVVEVEKGDLLSENEALKEQVAGLKELKKEKPEKVKSSSPWVTVLTIFSIVIVVLLIYGVIVTDKKQQLQGEINTIREKYRTP